MRILHLIPTLSGGGAERQLALMAREHASQGVDVSIIYHGDGPNMAYLKKSEVELVQLNIRNNHDPMALWSIIQFIRKRRPDLVQTWLPQMDILGGIAARVCGVPHILSERASAMAYGSDWKSRLRARIGKHATAIIANSNTGARYWKEHGATGDMHVVVNAITPFGSQFPEPPEDLVHPAILYAGRIAPQKNLKNMVDALGLALRQKPDLHAYILGTGHQEDVLRGWIAKLEIAARIHVKGYVANLHPWYTHADVFVSVSDFEGHPNVVLEAASVGCPLVLSDIAEHREAVPADGALFVDGHNPADIAGALIASLDDVQAGRRRAAVAKDFVTDLSVENQAAKYADIYRKIVEK